MIIKIGNVSLQPWISIPYQDAWIRYVEYGSINYVKLFYNTVSKSWYPRFSGNIVFLNSKFEEMAVFDNHKYKHHLQAMEQLDKFLIRMGKLTLFL